MEEEEETKKSTVFLLSMVFEDGCSLSGRFARGHLLIGSLSLCSLNASSVPASFLLLCFNGSVKSSSLFMFPSMVLQKIAVEAITKDYRIILKNRTQVKEPCWLIILILLYPMKNFTKYSAHMDKSERFVEQCKRTHRYT